MAQNQALTRTVQSLQPTEGTSQNRGSHYGRMAKIEFPKFNGEDVKGWIFRCKQFFRIDGTEDDMKVEFASMHLYDKALTWHQQYVKKYGEGTVWEQYEEKLLERFGAIYEDPMGELKNLKQDSTIQHYQEVFEELLNRVELPELYAMSLLMGGLKKEISIPLRMFKLQTLAEACSMAKLQEASNATLKPRYTPPTPVVSKYAPHVTYSNKNVNMPAKPITAFGNNATIQKAISNRPYRLSQKEMGKKGQKGSVSILTRIMCLATSVVVNSIP